MSLDRGIMMMMMAVVVIVVIEIMAMLMAAEGDRPPILQHDRIGIFHWMDGSMFNFERDRLPRARATLPSLSLSRYSKITKWSMFNLALRVVGRLILPLLQSYFSLSGRMNSNTPSV